MQEKSTGIGKLLDAIKAQHDIKNDAALARDMDVAPPVISKLRNGGLELGATYILRMHETFGMPVTEIRDLIA
jgi:plasmid maintenance system antidote protein VapI